MKHGALWCDDVMQVRECSPDDLVQLRELWPSPDDVAGAHYAQQASGAATFLVGWHDRSPSGWAVLHWDGCVGSNARARFSDCAEVNHLQVRPGFRGRGTGTAILLVAEQLVRAQGGSKIAVSVDPSNTGASRLYRRLGYAPTGVTDVCEYTWFDVDGHGHTEIETYELFLRRLSDQSTAAS